MTISARGALPRRLLLLSLVAAAAGLAGCDTTTSDGPLAPGATAAPAAALAAAPTPTALAVARVFATGLRFPRGFTFGADGSLYVGEAGNGGSHLTTKCTQVVPPVGPYTGGRTARISRIDTQGHRTTLASGFPSGIAAIGDVQGVGDVAFLDGQLYALVSGGGCSHGSATIPAGVALVSPSGEWHIVADLSAYLHSHPVAHPEKDDFEPDGTWYSMRAVGDKLFALEPNHGDLVRIFPGTGRVSRLVDVSATQGHIVPTALAVRHGNLFFGNLGTFPIKPRSSKIFQVDRTGTLTVAARGFTTVVGLDFDPRGRMYVLETTHGAGFPTPGTGRVVRVNADGSRQVVVNGLIFPTAMRFGPDGRLYISNKGYGPPQPGEILRADVPGVTPAAVAVGPR
jgi:hypothetical protein